MNANITVDSIQLFHVFAGNSKIYRPRCYGQPDALSKEAAWPRAIVDRVFRSTEGDRIDYCLYKDDIVVLLPNQCKSKSR